MGDRLADIAREMLTEMREQNQVTMHVHDEKNDEHLEVRRVKGPIPESVIQEEE